MKSQEDLTINERIEELSEKKKDLSKRISKMHSEDFENDKELIELKLDRMLGREILQRIKWKYIINPKAHRHSFESLEERYEPKEIFSLVQFEHDSLEINEKVSLSFSDGELILHIDFDGLKYIKELNLNVDISDFKGLIEIKENELKELENIYSDFYGYFD